MGLAAKSLPTQIATRADGECRARKSLGPDGEIHAEGVLRTERKPVVAQTVEPQRTVENKRQRRRRGSGLFIPVRIKGSNAAPAGPSSPDPPLRRRRLRSPRAVWRRRRS